MIDMHRIMMELSQERPVFHSEGDFRYELGRKLQETFQGEDFEVRSEYPIPEGISLPSRQGPRAHIDMIVRWKDIWIPIELKYKTASLFKESQTINLRDEDFEVPDQGKSTEIRRGFFIDIYRLERVVELRGNAVGYAILLTNKHLLYDDRDPNDRVAQRDVYGGRFRLRDGRSCNPMNVSKNGEEERATVREYVLKWRMYSELEDAELNSKFFYLLIEVNLFGLK